MGSEPTRRTSSGSQPTQPGDADLAAVGALLADRARARILLALADGRALPATLLASEAGVSASTASAHLSRLLGGRLWRCSRRDAIATTGSPGRRSASSWSRWRGRGPRRSGALASRGHTRACRQDRAHLLRPPRRPSRRRAAHRHDRARLGERRGRARDRDRRRGPAGIARARSRLPADAGRGRRPPRPWRGPTYAKSDGTVALRYCVDWSEQRHHVSGAVGRAWLSG